MQTAVFVGLLHALFDAFIGFIYANVPPFRRRWGVTQMPDLSGRVVIVTGGNVGIGFATCLELVRRGAKVYLASRTESRAKTAIQKIKQLVPDAQLEFIHFDLTILSSAKAAAEEFKRKESRLDILINNAAVMGTRYELSPDGIEVQACNATGHFALTSHLLPILRKTASSISGSHVRIINVASIGHITATDPDLSSLQGINRPNDWPMSRYTHSKLNNILFTNELQKRLSDTNIYCLSVHPGLVASQITRSVMGQSITDWFADFATYIVSSPYDGALTQLYAATSPEIESKRLRAAYLVPYGQVGRKSLLAQDHDGKMGQQFWDLCEKLMQEAENK
ncbi:hypothetical protein, variant [Puccinia triticina 1-1 BBBD Race 1]|uniref:Uncharacterized protein n=2 Tax=Puccinia triticina TaxID=208348 RepID=A0A180GWY0_PUCT1|nr:uncharacterized protein PtA15_3A689 [Puccinia triticina]OAV96482.1 hypothetical protein PTTG_00946 [Puccinia triticina 1-1 BBBD Race 1]OAV96483.1 hypothetical protein, variant [Puccinia triticina 1-1 BBBD Race 1]WAQ83320.1 hypothetical protein PtA15_3A689 [Puccinia triticina]WAR54170.1 hypothetical protein PtB15_3B683 [Puccinia triticina]